MAAAVLLLGALLAQEKPPLPAPFAWESDLETAVRRSKEDGRPVILYFTFDTCGWCKKLQKDAFPDAAVERLGQRFHWVYADRDRSPELPRRFQVSSYPTLLTVEPEKLRKVHRFSGYRDAGRCRAELEDALARWELFRAGKEWDAPKPRPDRICDRGDVTTIAAPSADGPPGGIAFLDGRLWLVQERQLHRIDPAEGMVEATFEIPWTAEGLAADGKVLYAMEYAWTRDAPIHVIDPATGKETRSIVTKANEKNQHAGARGVAWWEGSLYVLEGAPGTIHRVDPATGEVTAKLATGETWLGGLAQDGRRFLTGSRTHLFFLDPAKGTVVEKIAVNYPLRTIAAGAGAIWLMEQPVTDHDVEHRPIRLWPKKMLIHRLRLPETTPAR